MGARSWWTLALLGGLSACGSHDAAPAPTPPPPSSAPASTTPPPSSIPPSSSPPPSSTGVAQLDAGAPTALGPEDRARLARAIHDGRHAAHEHDLAGALAQFETASSLAPGSSRVRCEAAFVAYEAGQLDRAEAHLRAALVTLPADPVPDADRVSTATCLYNAGLVYEARGRSDDARAAYTRSLALRPNGTVQHHLDGLAAGTAPRASEVFGPFGPTQTEAEIVAAARTFVCAQPAEAYRPGSVPCARFRPEITRAHADGPTPIDALVLTYDVESDEGEQIFALLVVRSADRVLSARLGSAYSPGVGGVSVELVVTPEVRDAIPGGSSELVVTVRDTLGDSDMGTCDYFESVREDTVVCSTDTGSLACISLSTADARLQDHEPCSDTFDEDGDGDYDEILATEEAVHTVDGYQLTITFGDGHVVLARASEDGGDAAPPMLGELTLLSLFGLHGLAWPAYGSGHG